MSGTPSSHLGRDKTGRFAKGNPFGQQTRYRPGQCGNPKGRPPAFWTCLNRFSEQRYGESELRRVIADPAARRVERDAARWGILWLTTPIPIAGADPVKSKAYYRRWYRKTYERLAAIYLDERESLERREAARRRLHTWWVAPEMQRQQCKA